MSHEELITQFTALYEEWGAAVRDHDVGWFDLHFAEDFLGTAVPWPTLSVSKQKMIELDESIEVMDAKWSNITARRYGDTVLTTGLVTYANEVFKSGASIADGMPTGEQLSSLVIGKTVLYVNAWRQKGVVWQMFDHHMVGLVSE